LAFRRAPVSAEKRPPTVLALSPFPVTPFLRLPEVSVAGSPPSGFLLLQKRAPSKAPSLHGRYPLPHYYGPLRLPARTTPRLFIPSGRWGRLSFPALPGLPGSSTDLSLRAVPNHPGRSDRCLLIASPPVSGFILSGGLATSTSVTRPNRVRWRYGSQVCFPGFHQPDCSDSLRFRYMHERAIYTVDSFRSTRSARLSLVHQMNADKKELL